MIPTPHIDQEDAAKIAKTVIMPGDPLRAQFIAETYLTDVEKINTVRNMFGFTGLYKGKPVTVMGSGMGMPSMGIYSFELFKFYDVDRIIRIGSCGSYTEDLKVYDVILTESAYCESDFIKIVTEEETRVVKPTAELNEAIEASAKALNVKIHKVAVHSTDVFYRKNFEDFKAIRAIHGCQVVEMESAALFANARATGKQAACVLTVSDCLVSHQATTSEERQNAFTQMMEVALGIL